MEILAWLNSLFAREKKAFKADWEQWEATKLADMAIAQRKGLPFDHSNAQKHDRVFVVRANALEELAKLTRSAGLSASEITHRLALIQGQLAMRAMEDSACTSEEKLALINAQQVVMRNSLAARRRTLAQSRGEAKPA